MGDRGREIGQTLRKRFRFAGITETPDLFRVTDTGLLCKVSVAFQHKCSSISSHNLTVQYRGLEMRRERAAAAGSAVCRRPVCASSECVCPTQGAIHI